VNTMVATSTSSDLHPWRALYWEPVAGTGERIMVGVLYGFNGQFAATRTIRDDVLDCLFGKAAGGLRKLIDHSLTIYATASAAASSVEPLSASLGGLHAGPLRATAAATVSELLHTACLLYSSLGNLDKLDETEDTDAPLQEDVNKRFSTEVRDVVAERRPDLLPGFGRGGVLIEGGQQVKFGYFSPKAVLHFTVLNPVRQGASVRDARARLFELQRARAVAGVAQAALIAAVPREDDATLGARQRERIRANRLEIEREADAVDMRWYAVSTAIEGAERLIAVAA